MFQGFRDIKFDNYLESDMEEKLIKLLLFLFKSLQAWSMLVSFTIKLNYSSII